MTLSTTTRDRLLASLAQLIRTGRQVSARAAAQLYGDLPSYGWALLLPLEQAGDLRLSDLAARAGIDISVASRQVGALERAGYVTRRPDPRDGRAFLLSLSPLGGSALAATRMARAGWAATALAGWDEDDAVHLIDLLDRLVVDVEAAAPTPAAARPAPVVAG